MMHDDAAAAAGQYLYPDALLRALRRRGLETTGLRDLGPEDVAEAMTWPGIIGLGEMMNFPGVANAIRQDAGRNRSDPACRQDRGRALCFSLT